MLGWVFDLDSRTVFIAEHNFLKTLYGFFMVDTSSKVSIKTMETLASWASRYSEMSRLMKPFVNSLHAFSKGFSNRNISLPVPENVKQDINMWRTYLCATYLNEAKLARPLESFRDSEPDVVIQYDASLGGIGVIIKPAGALHWSYGFAAEFPFDLGSDSSYQNSAEFMALLFGMLAILVLKLPFRDIHLIGDSKSSLKWADTDSFKGERNRRAAVLFTTIGSTYNFNIRKIEFVPGVDNVICDQLSRDENTPEVLSRHGIPAAFSNQPSVFASVFKLVNPLVPLLTDEDYGTLWDELAFILGEISSL